MRNASTDWSNAHLQLALGSIVDGEQVGGCRKRLGMTATPVFNRPRDLTGVCMAMGADLRFRMKDSWTSGDTGSAINPRTVLAFQPHCDRVRDDILRLPPLTHTTFDFQARLNPCDVSFYNDKLETARNIKHRIGSEQKASSVDLRQLMGSVQRLQQALVSPLLARHGAKYFSENPAMHAKAALVETGALRALYTRIRARQAEGYNRILVACEHVTLLEIARHFLLRQPVGVGRIYSYDGRSPLAKRQRDKRDFLTGELTVMLLSISAGGTGLHLAPGCRCCVFWGSRPFSPAQTHQTSKRIHRIGQHEAVQIDHLIANGSVDHSIDLMHGDKRGLADALVDGDWRHFEGGNLDWRRSGRIVENCLRLDSNGNFVKRAPDQQGKRKRPASPGARATKQASC